MGFHLPGQHTTGCPPSVRAVGHSPKGELGRRDDLARLSFSIPFKSSHLRHHLSPVYRTRTIRTSFKRPIPLIKKSLKRSRIGRRANHPDRSIHIDRFCEGALIREGSLKTWGFIHKKLNGRQIKQSKYGDVFSGLVFDASQRYQGCI